LDNCSLVSISSQFAACVEQRNKGCFLLRACLLQSDAGFDILCQKDQTWLLQISIICINIEKADSGSAPNWWADISLQWWRPHLRTVIVSKVNKATLCLFVMSMSPPEPSPVCSGCLTYWSNKTLSNTSSSFPFNAKCHTDFMSWRSRGVFTGIFDWNIKPRFGFIVIEFFRAVHDSQKMKLLLINDSSSGVLPWGWHLWFRAACLRSVDGVGALDLHYFFWPAGGDSSGCEKEDRFYKKMSLILPSFRTHCEHEFMASSILQ